MRHLELNCPSFLAFQEHGFHLQDHLRVQEGYRTSSHQSIFHQAIIKAHSGTKQVKDDGTCSWKSHTAYRSLMCCYCNNYTRKMCKHNCLAGHNCSDFSYKGGPGEQSQTLYARPPKRIQDVSIMLCLSALIKYDYPSEFKFEQLYIPLKFCL